MQELCEHFLQSSEFESSSFLLHIWQAESATEHLVTVQLRHPDPQPLLPIKYHPLFCGPLCLDQGNLIRLRKRMLKNKENVIKSMQEHTASTYPQTMLSTNLFCNTYLHTHTSCRREFKKSIKPFQRKCT